MSEPRQGPRSRHPVHPLVGLLAVIIAAECALLLVAVAYLTTEIFTSVPASYPGAIALIVLAAVAVIWLAFIVANILRGMAWVRGATVVWQVLQIAVAIGCFQGYLARPDVGWLLLLPSLAVLVLLFTPTVIRATARRNG